MPKGQKRVSSQACDDDDKLAPEIVADAIKAILTLDHSKRPIKVADIISVSKIQVRRKQQIELWTEVRNKLSDIGMVLTECESGHSKAFLLTSKQADEPFLREFASKEERADRTLLVLILAYIFMKDGVTTEDEVLRHLSQLEIFSDGSKHEYFGDVKNKLQNKFVDQLYLQRSVLAEVENVELRWGQRATLEVDPMLILKFVCAVGYGGQVEPKNWPSQFERAQVEMREGQDLDVYMHGSTLQQYWVAVSFLIVSAGGGLLAILVCWYHRRCRHNGAYAYTALQPEPVACERLELERKTRERASSVCVAYLRQNPRYVLIRQLNDIGSRVDKHWFLVRDQAIKTERLLTLLPRGANSPAVCGPESRDAIRDLFRALQHPYIHPVLDVDFHNIGSRSYMMTTIPVSDRGSLKDLIYGSVWDEDWSRKYGRRGTGLPLPQAARLGRQVLEALLFLRDRGFPPGHLHSGNVVLQHGVARLAGLEAALLGAKSRILPLIPASPNSIDALAFGHVLFEMCAGYELDTSVPTPGHLLDLHTHPQVLEVLDLIFESPAGTPSLETLLRCELFRNIDLREMRNQAQSTQVFKTFLTPAARDLLHELRGNLQGRRPLGSASSPVDPCPSQPIRSASSGGSDDEQDDEAAYDADATSDPDIPMNKEHRSLTLHSVSASRYPMREINR